MGYDRRHDGGRRQYDNSSRISYDERDDDYYDRSRDRNNDNSYRSYKDRELKPIGPNYNRTYG